MSNNRDESRKKGKDEETGSNSIWILGLFLLAPYYLMAAALGVSVGMLITGEKTIFNAIPALITVYAFHRFLDRL
jgi:hypothetical protein